MTRRRFFAAPPQSSSVSSTTSTGCLLPTPQSLPLLLLRWCGQMLAPPHSLHCFHKRWWEQRLEPPHSLHRLLLRWWGQMLTPPHSLHVLLLRWCGHFEGSFLRAPGVAAIPHPPCGCLSAAPSPSSGSAGARRFFPAVPGPELTSEPRRARLSVDAPHILLVRTRNLLSSPRSVPLRLFSSPNFPEALFLSGTHSLSLTRTLAT